jgi:hypothetical protein
MPDNTPYVRYSLLLLVYFSTQTQEVQFSESFTGLISRLTFAARRHSSGSPRHLGERARTPNRFFPRQPKGCELAHHRNCEYNRNRAHRTLMTEDCLLTATQIYSAALVFVTQRLWTRQSLRADQTLTATHDSAAAWTGIGSALSQLWTQRTASGSVIGVLSVFLYLANILVLHITTPALFSFETFNSTRPFPVATRSRPSLDSFSQVNWSDPGNASTAMYVEGVMK